MRQNVQNWIYSWFEKHVGISREIVITNIDTNYFDNSWLDSFGFIGFISEIEGHFNIEFSNDEFTDRTFATLRGLTEHIINKLSK
jgi:acyl carrier protein